MRNWIKYPPLEWRKRHNFCTPRGPIFSLAPWITLYLAGSRLRIKAPKHSPCRPILQVKRPARMDVLSPPQLDLDWNKIMANDWEGSVLLARTWGFYGPWMTGCKAELSLSVSVFGRLDDNDVSLFNPRAFENIIEHYLNDRYGYFEKGDVQAAYFTAPLDWQVHNNFPVPSASFKIGNAGGSSDRLTLTEFLLVFPVTDKYFTVIGFRQDVFSFNEDGTPLFDISPVQKLQDKIVKSISLELSAEIQDEFKKVKREIGEATLREEFAPLKWPTGVYPKGIVMIEIDKEGIGDSGSLFDDIPMEGEVDN